MSPRGILHLVNEQVSNLVVEEQCNVSGTLCGTEGLVSGQGDFDEVRQPVGTEQLLQFGDCQRQQSKQGEQDGPLLIPVSDRRQCPDAVQQAL